MDKILRELNIFIGKASLATYAGSGPESDAQTAGLIKLEFNEGKWHYSDTYSGFFQSWGQELVCLSGKPFWTQIYGGGVEGHRNKKFAVQTFEFLKKALSAGEKIEMFQPRGPRKFAEGKWQYSCRWKGDITKFSGEEKIAFKGKNVFSHKFLGGLVLD